MRSRVGSWDHGSARYALHIQCPDVTSTVQVELPMVLEMDNMGAVDLANNWRVGGRTHHVDVRHHFLRDLKDNGILIIRHVSGDDNDADIFTKNTTGPIFEIHIPRYVGHDEYIKGDAPNLG